MAKPDKTAVPTGVLNHLARRGITSKAVTENIIASLGAAGRLTNRVGGATLRDPIAYPDEIDAELRRFMRLPGGAQ